MRMRKSLYGVLAIVAFLALIGAKCGAEQSTQEAGEQRQEGIMKKAQQNVPVPEVDNFRTRKAVAKWMERMDVPDKVFYVYLLGDNGQKIGYYVASTRPISICTFMTPPEREIDMDYGDSKLGTAPSLDGVYRKGGGCDTYYFFDAQTDAMHSFSGVNYLTSDKPLRVEVEPLSVTTIDDVQKQEQQDNSNHIAK